MWAQKGRGVCKTELSVLAKDRPRTVTWLKG